MDVSSFPCLPTHLRESEYGEYESIERYRVSLGTEALIIISIIA